MNNWVSFWIDGKEMYLGVYNFCVYRCLPILQLGFKSDGFKLKGIKPELNNYKKKWIIGYHVELMERKCISEFIYRIDIDVSVLLFALECHFGFCCFSSCQEMLGFSSLPTFDLSISSKCSLAFHSKIHVSNWKSDSINLKLPISPPPKLNLTWAMVK